MPSFRHSYCSVLVAFCRMATLLDVSRLKSGKFLATSSFKGASDGDRSFAADEARRGAAPRGADGDLSFFLTLTVQPAVNVQQAEPVAAEATAHETPEMNVLGADWL